MLRMHRRMGVLAQSPEYIHIKDLYDMRTVQIGEQVAEFLCPILYKDQEIVFLRAFDNSKETLMTDGFLDQSLAVDYPFIGTIGVFM